jgi:rubrerythrin
MTNVTLEYMSAIADELANLADMNGYPSLVKLFRAAAAEAEHLQKPVRVPNELTSPEVRRPNGTPSG